jgi:ABC-type multidrug transport system fused ATPase/permease subunit
LQALMDLYLRIERAGVSLDRIFEFLDVGKDQIEQGGQGRQLASVRGDVEFRRVSFAYDGKRPILQEVSFRVRGGERLTILGPSGIGKTTITDLLVRLYEPNQGEILLDGIDIRTLALDWLRQHVAVLSHEPFLFHASLIENIRYASPQASEQEVSVAAQTVGLHDFIQSLPQKYETVVGDRGAQLSAGQKQRIALARAVLRQPKVLVLDEALSGLDVESETRVRGALAMVLPGTTTLVVTHRLSSLRETDRVVILDGGRAVWEGWYKDHATVPGELRVRMQEWEAVAVHE